MISAIKKRSNKGTIDTLLCTRHCSNALHMLTHLNSIIMLKSKCYCLVPLYGGGTEAQQVKQLVQVAEAGFEPSSLAPKSTFNHCVIMQGQEVERDGMRVLSQRDGRNI